MTEEITSPDGAFAIIALEWLARNQVTIVWRREKEYGLRLYDGAISRQVWPTAAAAVAAGIAAGGLPDDLPR